MGIIAVEAKPHIVDHSVRNCARPTQGQQLRVDTILGREVSAPDGPVASPRRILTLEMTITVASEQIIELIKVVINSAVE